MSTGPAVWGFFAPSPALTCPMDCMPASRNALAILLGHIFWFGFTWRVNCCARHGSTPQSKTQKGTTGSALLDRPLAAGTWVREEQGPSLPPVRPTPPPPPLQAWGTRRDCQGMRPRCSRTRAKRGPCVRRARAGRSRRCCCNRSSARPLEQRQLAPTHRPNFTRKHSHVYMDATAIRNMAINSMQATAGVAGCFAINSRENASSCDSRTYAHAGFCPLSLELL